MVISLAWIAAFPRDEKIDGVVGDKEKSFAVQASNEEITENQTEPDAIETSFADEEIGAIDPRAQTIKPIFEQERSNAVSSALDNPQYEYYYVSNIVDGDTIKVSINGATENLRLIGIDTPETVDPRKPVQCFGKEASDKAKELLSGKKIRIEKDPTQGDFDKYGRRLAYVYREDGLFYNKYMIERGYAFEYTYIAPYKYQAEFKLAEQSAKNKELGLWSPDACGGETALLAVNPSSDQSILMESGANISSEKYYTSSYHTAVYYYPESCAKWKTLSKKYLESYDSLEVLLKAYPTKTASPQCQ